jgi:hypothetical protein
LPFASLLESTWSLSSSFLLSVNDEGSGHGSLDDFGKAAMLPSILLIGDGVRRAFLRAFDSLRGTLH